MEIGLLAMALGLVYFAIQVPMDPQKTKLQRYVGATVVLVGTCVFLLLVLTA